MSKIAPLPKLQSIDLGTFTKNFGDDPSASLWVVNRSGNRAANNAGRPNAEQGTMLGGLGNIMFSVTGDDARPTSLVVPVTFIPIDLSVQAPVDNLIRSTHFRAAISQGRIAIVNPSCLNEFFQHPVAANEYRRINDGDWTPIGGDGLSLDQGSEADRYIQQRGMGCIDGRFAVARTVAGRPCLAHHNAGHRSGGAAAVLDRSRRDADRGRIGGPAG